MSCKPLTRKEWQASLAEMWEAAVESTYKDLIAEAVAAEREACAQVCDDINAKYEWPDDVAERVASQWCADSIRARGQA